MLRHFPALTPEPTFPTGLHPVAFPTAGSTQPKPSQSGGQTLLAPTRSMFANTAWKKLIAFEDKSFEEMEGRDLVRQGRRKRCLHL